MGVATLSGGDSDTEKRIRDFLQETGFGDAWDRQPGDEVVDVVLADGHTSRSMLAGKMCRAAVEITLPSSGYLNFRPRTYMGLNGTLFLLEEILNGLRGMP
jgi:nitrogenase molybdenum-iron protein alpha/beta subunit